jgi:acetyl-CoA carboxylase biotin carboxyl carrier protein
MDTRKIRKLIELVKETGIGELEIKSGEESVRISCQKNVIAAPGTLAAPYEVSAAPATQPAPAPQASAATPESTDGHTVPSPMVGTVYLAPSSGAMPFVQVGDNVKAGDTLCLIEAMKMFNKIEADISGVISARLIENEQPVEYSQPLFIIEPAE